MEPAEVEHGKPLEEPENKPEKEGEVFEYWCSNEELTDKYDFKTPVSGTIGGRFCD